jgi:chemotaxis protein methyltransferase CheR
MILAHIDEVISAITLLEEDIEIILTEIFKNTGYDFKDYSAVIVKRRLQRRLIFEGMSSLRELIHKIQNEPNYAFHLVSDFSINVTEMFRDPHLFKFFRERVIPNLKEQEFIRIWAAGCSTGEEVFSLAILLYEEGLYDRCRIYATDMNESIILQAKTGRVFMKKMQEYSNNYITAAGTESLNQYFYLKEESLYLRPDLMRNILFSHHNLVTDRSFNEFHVIFCRNVLIYFNQSLRNHVHSLLYESLALNGYLVLGDRETIRFTKHAPHYSNLSPRQRIYKRIN